MRNATASKQEIKATIHQFRELCDSLNIRLGVHNSLDERIAAAEMFSNALTNFDLTDVTVVQKCGEFLTLSDCLHTFKDVLKSSVYHRKIIKKDYFDSVLATLVAARVCKDAGLEISFKEPDLLVNVDGATMSIACKRVRSLRKLDELLHNGRDQVSRAGYPGIIFLDISEVMVPDPPLNMENEMAIHACMTAWIERFLDEREKRVFRILWRSEQPRHRAVGNVIFFRAQLYGIRQSTDLIRMIREYLPYYITHLFCLSNPKREAVIKAFEEKILPLSSAIN